MMTPDGIPQEQWERGNETLVRVELAIGKINVAPIRTLSDFEQRCRELFIFGNLWPGLRNICEGGLNTADKLKALERSPD